MNEKALEELLDKKFKQHICSIYYLDENKNPTIGTGNLFKHNDDLFIITCEHVATSVVVSDYVEISFFNKTTLLKDKIVLANKDEDADIALIKVIDMDIKGLTPFTLDDLVDVTQEKEFIKENSIFIIVGFPGQTIRHEEKYHAVPLFFLMTFDGITSDKIRFDYPYGDEEIPTLPKAFGLSGAGIWSLDSIVYGNGLVSPTDMRCVAIQHAWVKGEYIVGSPLTRILEWVG